MKCFTILVLLLIKACLFSQDVTLELIASMPEPVTNHAIASINIEGREYVYTFGGMDRSKACGRAHLHAFKYNVVEDRWSQLSDLPDPIGGIVAAGASAIGDYIYIVGGYHITPSCTEESSGSLIRFDPRTDTYETMAPPVPIDDHVQAVYKDSLLFVVTGWSQNNNVTNVQIYNPGTNQWTEGTRLPNSFRFRVFGASGVIVGDTLYYNGGARATCNPGNCFAPNQHFRKGYIDPNDPTQISWIGEDNDEAQGYRMAATTWQDLPMWVGGSDLTYNFDGVDYNGSGVVSPRSSIQFFANKQLTTIPDVILPTMDLRGLAKLSNNRYLIAGGIGEDTTVLDRAFIIQINDLTNTLDLPNEENIKAMVMVVSDQITSLAPLTTYLLIDVSGKSLQALSDSDGTLTIPVALQKGAFWLCREGEACLQYFKAY